MHQTNPAFRASVDGLFQSFKIEVDRLGAAASSALSSSPATPANNKSWGAKVASYHDRNSHSGVHEAQPRDYEVLADLSLLAWGDAWVGAGTHHQVSISNPLTKCCGGGWNLKGSEGAWSGLRFTSARRNDDGDLGGVH